MKLASSAIVLTIGQLSSVLGHNQDATWGEKYGPQYDLEFSGPLSFSHLPYIKCLEQTESLFDVAILGIPFDTAVSYRPGARFGPHAIRSGSRRLLPMAGYTLPWGLSPYDQGVKILDCGDVPVSPFDNALAIDQMEVAYSTLLRRPPHTEKSIGTEVTKALAIDGVGHPRIISLGGDHTIVLPILRSLYKIYGPISVIHFDAHLDTWAPAGLFGRPTTDQARINHGTFFYIAQEEGLISNHSIHAGIRCNFLGPEDLENDRQVGFTLISADDIDDLGVNEVVRRIRERVGDRAVYLSLDIDVIDPGLAPGTGTPEIGGWTTRELKRIIRGLIGLNLVGADIVEVSPAYDNGEITGLAAANFVHDLLSLFHAQRPTEPDATFVEQSSYSKVEQEL